MRLLDRYLLRELLIPLGYCLGGFLIFWVTFDLFAELEGFLRRRLLARDIAEYYLIRTPELLVNVTPIALLLALLYSLTNHARHQEITAIRAAGVSLGRLCIPYMGVGVVLSLGVFALNELWVPEANDTSDLVLARRQAVDARGLGPAWHKNLAFRNERDRRIWNIGAFNRETGEMLSPNFEWELPDGFRHRVAADRAMYRDGVWLFQGAREFVYEPGVSLPPPMWYTNQVSFPEITETPDQIRSEIKFTALSNVRAAKRPVLSLREISNYQRLHPHLPEAERFKLETQFHGRLAEPWTCLIVVLIAIPFGAPSGRRNVFVGVAFGIFIAFGYLVIERVLLALGTGGNLTPWIAAWAPNLVFGLAGLTLMRRVR
ncbi:MAG: LptF/LptG family permease [Limisphaerales bacterium]